jgi:hypothetical protein
MKKNINILLVILVLVYSKSINAQIKIYNDNHVSIASLTQTGGVQIAPTGRTAFQPAEYASWAWLNMIFAPLSTSKCWIVIDNQGVHTFEVHGNGDVKCRSLTQTSDESVKTNITQITNATQKIMSLRGIYFDFIDETTHDTLVYTDKYGNAHTYVTNMENEEDLNNNENVDPSAVSALISERDRQHMGLIAQEVEQVVPEVVRTQTDGKKAIAYANLVALLIEAFKEQQVKINELEQYIQNCCEFNDNIRSKRTDTEINQTKNGSSVLYQNSPNPFNEKTIIEYEIGEKAFSEANIYVFDLNGKLLKTYPLNSAKGNIEISAFELEPGMYLYSLVVNKKEIDTKRMILTQ